MHKLKQLLSGKTCSNLSTSVSKLYKSRSFFIINSCRVNTGWARNASNKLNSSRGKTADCYVLTWIMHQINQSDFCILHAPLAPSHSINPSSLKSISWNILFSPNFQFELFQAQIWLSGNKTEEVTAYWLLY